MLRIRIRTDPELFQDPNPDPELLFRIRIQQKIEEQTDKNLIYNFRPVNSGVYSSKKYVENDI